MSRTLTRAAFVVLALAACKGGGDAPKKSGPAVATGKDFTITADELKARLDEQSPFIRARFATLERKKEFLDNLVKFEVLATEAKKKGFDKDPDVQNMLKRLMVQKLVQKSFADDAEAAKRVPDADVKAYYDQHQDEFHRPAKVRVAQILVKSGPGAEAQAKKLLERVRAEEKKSPSGFSLVAREASQDEATKPTGGDLGFKSKEELAAQSSPQVADAAFQLKDGEVSNVVPTTLGLAIVKRMGWQDPLDRSFDDVKAQVAAKLARERRAKDFDEYVKKLRQDQDVKVDEKALEAVPVSAAPAAGAMGGGMGGMGGMTGGMRGGMGGAGGMPPGHGGGAPAPAAPAPAPAPASAPAAPAQK